MQTVADPGRARLVRQRLAQRLVDAFVRVNALDGHAHLAAVDEGGEKQLRGHGFWIDVLQDDGRIIATELERDALEGAGSAGHDLLAAGDRSGERNLVDTGMRAHPLPAIIVAGKNIDHAWGKDIAQQLSELERAHRCVGRGLEHHGIAGVERHGQRAGGQIDRCVPRCDHADHAERQVVQFDAALRIIDNQFTLNRDRRDALGLDSGACDLVASL